MFDVITGPVKFFVVFVIYLKELCFSFTLLKSVAGVFGSKSLLTSNFLNKFFFKKGYYLSYKISL